MASTVYKYTFIVMSLGVGAAGALKLLSDVDTGWIHNNIANIQQHKVHHSTHTDENY
jgi:hypothetical protein